MKIKDAKDFWSGVMFAVFGLAFMVFARQYDMGTAARMGPAYFPTALGLLLAGVYAVSSLAQVVVGRLIDRVSLKRLQLTIVLAQAPLLLLASQAQGWWLYATLIGVMVMVFGSIPFTDAVIAKGVADPATARQTIVPPPGQPSRKSCQPGCRAMISSGRRPSYSP